MDPITSAKLLFAIKSVLVLGFFTLLFLYYYRRMFWQDALARKLFWIFSGIFAPLVIVKFLIGAFNKGYVPELWFFYAIPSPKALGFLWFLLAIGTVLLFLRFRRKLEALPLKKFLAALVIASFVFSVSVAGIREGHKSIQDPFTRTYWEYTGFLPEIQSVKSFLSTYVERVADPKLDVAVHSSTHPPGYTLVLYFWYRLTGAGFLGLSLFVIALAALSLIPVWFFWREFLPDLETRRAVEIFAFMPGLVMMSATSMEGFLVLVVSSALAFSLLGWRKSYALAILGGVVAGYAVFSNFLVLLLAPLFGWLAWYVLRRMEHDGSARVLARMGISLAAFALFFGALFWWAEYSIIENFFVAQANNYAVEGSNYESLLTFATFFFINISDFLTYVGLPLAILFFLGLPTSFREAPPPFTAGLLLVLFFLLLPIFQGNIGRLWLFIFPLFAGVRGLLLEEGTPAFGPFLSLTAFQVIIMQGVFYTFF